MFGRVAQVVQDRWGRIFVLDRGNAEVRVFSPEGQYLFTIGKAGEGPGEFIDPEFIAIDSYDSLYVLDQGIKVNIFAFNKISYVFRRYFILQNRARSWCVNDSLVFINISSTQKDSLIHVYNKNGELIGKFGYLNYNSNNPLVLNYINRGLMLCNRDKIFLLFEFLPIIKVYDFKGNLLWQVYIQNLNLKGFTEGKEGNILFTGKIDKNFTDIIWGFNKFDNILMVQYISLPYSNSNLAELFGKSKTFIILINIYDMNSIIDTLGFRKIFINTDSSLIAQEYEEIPHISYYSY